MFLSTCYQTLAARPPRGHHYHILRLSIFSSVFLSIVSVLDHLFSKVGLRKKNFMLFSFLLTQIGKETVLHFEPKGQESKKLIY